MTIKKSKNMYETLNESQRKIGSFWFSHYYDYLLSISYQLIEWEGLPDTIDPNYLEKTLHNYGFVGFYKDPEIDFIVTSGSSQSIFNHYNVPIKFQSSAVGYDKAFNLFNYGDQIPDNIKNYGVLIRNNDMSQPTINSINLFAHELAQLKQIINVNLNAQKTPVLISTDKETLLTMKNVYSQFEGNSPVIIVDNKIDMNTLKVHKTDAPFVVDKITLQRNSVWNEFLTFIGINNISTDKKERMITNEVDGNNEQITASSNTFLKSRMEACNLINQLYGLNVSVKLRNEIIEEVKGNLIKNIDTAVK